jgi:gamma-glutamyltranspeptidase/glutathione hydrolase
MVVSHSVESAEAGAAVLRAGGTAFDAAVSMGFVAAVREMAMSSIGGVGALLAFSGQTQQVTEIDFYGRTPMGLQESAFVPYLLDPSDAKRSSYGWRGVDGARNDRGFLSVGVPTYVGGMGRLHESLGTVSWRDLLRPAADLARGGFVSDEEITSAFAAYHRHLDEFEEFRRIYLANGIPTPAGAYPGQGIPIVQRDLADTIDQLGAEGPGWFYSGPVADKISSYIQSGGGVLDVADFRRIEPAVAAGTRGSYRGYDVVVSSGMTGGSTLLEMLNIAENFDLGAKERYSSELLILLLEIMRQAWTDRMVYLGDPEVSAVPDDGIVDKRFAADVSAHIRSLRIPERTRPGDPWRYSSAIRRDSPPAGERESTDTTHLIAADRFGNVVTLTQTLGLPFGSCVVTPETGVLLSDVAMWLNPEPGTPNSVGPWKRQLGQATPVLVLRDGKPVAALGAPGGRPVVTSMFQAIVGMVDFGMDVQEAIGAPRVHMLGADPERPRGNAVHSVIADDRLPAEVIAELRRHGYTVSDVYETGTQSRLARPLGIEFRDDGSILGGVDIFRRSIGIGV